MKIHMNGVYLYEEGEELSAHTIQCYMHVAAMFFFLLWLTWFAKDSFRDDDYGDDVAVAFCP